MYFSTFERALIRPNFILACYTLKLNRINQIDYKKDYKNYPRKRVAYVCK